MVRWTLLAVLGLTLVGCARRGPPIGYTPESPDTPTRVEDPPTGGGGFEFGAAIAKVRAKCDAEHGKFEQSGHVSTCLTRHADIGAMVTLVEYCGGAACRVHTVLMLERADAASWLVPFEHLRRQLLRQYGDPDQNDTRFPADCETDFASCVRNGSASATLRWRWDDGHAVMLRIGSTAQVPAAISVSYSDARATPAR